MPADEQAAIANRRYAVTSSILASIDSLMGKIRHLLRADGGSPINPDTVYNLLLAAGEGRNILPGCYPGGMTLHPYPAVPVPIYIWVKVAWVPTELCGITWQTMLALNDMRVPYVGTLLLYTEEELAARCNARAVGDIKSCLEKHGLRLPTTQELAVAKGYGFWVELPDIGVNGQAWNLRIAKELARWVPIGELFRLRDSQGKFFDWAEMTTLGDLLGQTEDAVRESWESYVFHIYTSNNAVREEDIPEPKRDELFDEIHRQADATVDWAAAAGLQFAQ